MGKGTVAWQAERILFLTPYPSATCNLSAPWRSFRRELVSGEVQATGPPTASPRPDRIPLLILACGGSWHPPPSGLGLVCSLQYRKPQIVLPIFSVPTQAVLVVDVHSTVTSNRLDHSLLVPVQGCTGTILSGFQSVRLPLDKKKQNKKKKS